MFFNFVSIPSGVLIFFAEANDFSNKPNVKYSWYVFGLAPNVYSQSAEHTKAPRLVQEKKKRGKGSCNQMFKFALELFHFVFHSLFRIL